jgi:hypothetical protein
MIDLEDKLNRPDGKMQIFSDHMDKLKDQVAKNLLEQNQDLAVKLRTFD